MNAVCVSVWVNVCVQRRPMNEAHNLFRKMNLGEEKKFIFHEIADWSTDSTRTTHSFETSRWNETK